MVGPAFPEPKARQERLDKSILALRKLLPSGDPAKVIKAAERVRLAALALLKARRSHVAAQPAIRSGKEWRKHGERLTKQLANLDRETDQWKSVSADEIVAMYQ
jgi:hypothetical protein